ncbi:uncharacterized protein BJ171DRAFT_515603 [Polychytrium aggregatum]|uniref:uncharacterized protein n=1 Tax=Polychytrium aggregatum TaxID=110093 RepID=UPI0022FE4F86|nr:uncharacterized protein BJ171DRAFT_515603 [Polychytrium aggregatum]KAI9202069.1 hypothetical protein BJ171DRAFT_515603 [Polychytrium aggregatum]
MSEQQPGSAISQCPPELLGRIFSYSLDSKQELLNYALVSKTWFGPAIQQFWYALDWSVDDWDLLRSRLSSYRSLYVDYRKYIHRFHLWAGEANQGDLKLSNIRKILQGCTKLTTLHVDYPVLNDDDLWIISSVCQRTLTSFSAVSPLGSGLACITDEGLSAITSQCKQLRHFRVKTTMQGTSIDRSIVKLAESLPPNQLQTFGLEWVGEVSFVDNLGKPLDLAEAERRMADALGHLIRTHPGIKTFVLDWPVAMDFTLLTMSQHLTSLEALHIGNPKNLDHIVSVLYANPRIRQLSLFEVHQAADPTVIFRPLLGLPPGPSPVQMMATPDQFVDGSTSPQLSAISMDLDCFTGTENTSLAHLELDGVGFVRNVLPLVSKFTNLRVLIVNASRRSASLHHLTTDQHLEAIARSCQGLQILRVPILGDGPLIQIAQSCLDIETLDLVDGRHVSPYTLTLVAKQCQKLKELHLGSAALVRDETIELIARSLPGLVDLGLPYGNTNLTERSLDHISRYSLALKYLYNIPVTISVDHFVTYLPKLKQLITVGTCTGVSGAPGSPVNSMRFYHPISREDQERIKAVCPKLRHIIHNRR